MIRTAVRYERPRSRSGAWAGRLGVFGILLFGFAATGQRFGMLQTDNFVAITALSVLFAALALLLGLVGIWRLWSVGAKGGRSSFWGMMLALAVVIPSAIGVAQFIEKPYLRDISTDSLDEPQFLREPVFAESWLSSMVPPRREPTLAEQTAAYPGLTGRRYEGAIDRVSTAVAIVLDQRGIVIVETEGFNPVVPAELPELEEEATVEDNAVESTPPPEIVNPPLPMPAPRDPLTAAPIVRPSRAVIQGEASTPILAIKSDVVIRLIEEVETTRVDMRSSTRHAGHDLGLNAGTIERFLTALDAELLGVAVD